MRRFWLLLLVLVLPIQMSWAAVHICDDEGSGEATESSAAMWNHDHESDQVNKFSDAQKSEKIADSCCGAAHGCHGLHHIMGQADPEFAPRATSLMPAPSGAAPPLSAARSRIERPNWLAA